MADTMSKSQRSKIMSTVRSKDTKMEVAFRKVLWKKGFRYRKNSEKYFGKPDIVLKKYETVVFLDSCFWHGCQKHFRAPATRNKYWETKIERNKQRDKKVNLYYKKLGWKIFRGWEHDILKKQDIIINKLSKLLKQS